MLVSILTFKCMMKHFMLSSVEHKKSFITSGLVGMYKLNPFILCINTTTWAWYFVACEQQRHRPVWAYKGTDQSGHQCSLISTFVKYSRLSLTQLCWLNTITYLDLTALSRYFPLYIIAIPQRLSRQRLSQ